MIVGYAYIVGDILHFGHIQHLKNCKALCDKLIVGVLTDEACMEKKAKPAISFSERLEMVRAIKHVDVTVAQTEYSPGRNVVLIKPDILFESASHQERFMNQFGRTMIMPYFPLQSSTKIKEKIREQS
jgi:cytidyltransferase-like protein